MRVQDSGIALDLNKIKECDLFHTNIYKKFDLYHLFSLFDILTLAKKRCSLGKQAFRHLLRIKL